VHFSVHGTSRFKETTDHHRFGSNTARVFYVHTECFSRGGGGAVGYSGNGDRVMTSPDGMAWTGQTAGAATGWYSVTFASSGSGDLVMTSSNGVA
jgi:hypothetical protein